MREGRFGKDFFVALVGSLLLLAAVSGVFLIDRDEVYHEVEWEAAVLHEQSEQDEAVAGEAAKQFSFELDSAPRVVYRVGVYLEWDDPVSDTFRLSVVAPNGTVRHIEDLGGSLSLEILVGGGGPAGSMFLGGDEERAIEQAWQGLDPGVQEAGQGTWNIHVALTEASRELLPGLEDPQEVGGNRFDLQITALGWEPVVQAGS